MSHTSSASTQGTNQGSTEATAAALRLGLSLLMRRVRARAAEGELGSPELAVLSLVDRAGPITIADLARRQQVTPQGVGATVASLETRGYVVRAADPDDKRRSLFTATDAGAEALTSGRGAIVTLMAAALEESFTPAEVATLAEAAPLIERLSHLI